MKRMVGPPGCAILVLDDRRRLVHFHSKNYTFGTTSMAPVLSDVQQECLEQLAGNYSAEALFDCLPDVVFFIKNVRCEYVVVNQTLVERCGRQSKQELIGRTADEVFPSALGRSYRLQDEAVLRSGVAIRNQLELHFYPTGRRGWCLTNKLPLRSGEGSVIGLHGLSKDLQAANERSDDFSQVAEAVERIRTGYGQPIQVSELAASASLSVYQFEQRIRRIFQVTAGQLIQKVRMDAAVERLLASDDSVATISVACGYSDQSAFTRKFRETVGLSPSEYRRAFRRVARGSAK
jgi:AraC-like DNA-binding protein